MAEQTQHHLTIPQYVADYELGNLEAQELVVDVATNLMHFAAAHGVDFDACLGTAEMHFSAEQAEEREGNCTCSPVGAGFGPHLKSCPKYEEAVTDGA